MSRWRIDPLTYRPLSYYDHPELVNGLGEPVRIDWTEAELRRAQRRYVDGQMGVDELEEQVGEILRAQPPPYSVPPPPPGLALRQAR